MNFVQKQDLFFSLEQFFNFTIYEQGVEHYTLLRESFFFHIKYLGLISILGLSIIGLPVIWGLIFIKGLVIGFSVGFIVSQLGSDGLLFAAFTVVPHNLLVIPVYIFSGALTMIFSLLLFKKIFSTRNTHSLKQPFFNYALLFSLLIPLSLGAAAIESFISMNLMEILIKSFYL